MLLKNKEINSLCNSRYTKQFFPFINNKLDRNKPSIVIKKDNVILQPQYAAEELGKFFYSTFIKDDGNLPVFDNIITTRIKDIAFDYECVLKHIIKLPNKFSSGPDNIPAIFLKQHANVLSLPLSLIFNDHMIEANYLMNGNKQMLLLFIKRKAIKTILQIIDLLA